MKISIVLSEDKAGWCPITLNDLVVGQVYTGRIGHFPTELCGEETGVRHLGNFVRLSGVLRAVRSVFKGSMYDTEEA